MATENPEDFYNRLEQELTNSTQWPSDYLYKFIIPTDEDKSRQISRIFDNTGAVIKSKQSRNGKYTSLSINVRMKNPQEVIEKYREVSVVKGVISL